MFIYARFFMNKNDVWKFNWIINQRNNTIKKAYNDDDFRLKKKCQDEDENGNGFLWKDQVQQKKK